MAVLCGRNAEATTAAALLNGSATTETDGDSASAACVEGVPQRTIWF